MKRVGHTGSVTLTHSVLVTLCYTLCSLLRVGKSVASRGDDAIPKNPDNTHESSRDCLHAPKLTMEATPTTIGLTTAEAARQLQVWGKNEM